MLQRRPAESAVLGVRVDPTKSRKLLLLFEFMNQTRVPQQLARRLL